MGTRTSISTSSTRSSDSTTAGRKMAYQRSDIRVILKDHYSSKVYTSSSPVAGEVTITTKREVPFDSIQIALLGQTTTTYDGVTAPQEVTHTFLKMIMPILESTYPEPRVLQSGRTYTLPFNFVVPNQLTDSACNHERLSAQLQDHHVLLPPSVGSWQRDDMAPRMVRVHYSVKARVLREDAGDERRVRIMEATRPIQVLPATPEQPPLNITGNDKLYRMAKAKTMRRNLLATKLGRLTAEAMQPSAAVLSSDGRRVVSHPMARVKLTFEPGSDRTLPPVITGVSAKLTAHTYFSTGAISDFPNLSEWSQTYGLDRRGQYFISTPLPSVALAEQPAWTPTAAPSPSIITRRDSGYCSSDSSDCDDAAPPSSSSSSSTTAKLIPSTITSRQSHSHSVSSSSSSSPSPSSLSHTTTLAIPLALPADKKTLLPTFHSCLASRVYTLQLALALSVRGAANAVSLVVPLQVAVVGETGLGGGQAGLGLGQGQEGVVGTGVGGTGGVTADTAAGEGPEGPPPSFEEAAADEHLRPRLLLAPPEGGRGGGGGGGDGERSAAWMMAPAAAVGAGQRLPGYGEGEYGRRVY